MAKVKVNVNNPLHPKTPHNFNSILGQLYSVSNAMYFINTDMDPRLLKRELTNSDMTAIYKASRHNVSNYWEIVKLLIVDRILSDKTLIEELRNKYKETGELDDYVIVHNQGHGIINTEVPNFKLATYGVKLTEVVHLILTTGGELEKLNSKEFKVIKQQIKENIFQTVLKRCSDNIATGVADVTNDELYKQFMK